MLETTTASPITSLADGQLHALHSVIALDGRISAYPASARGYSTVNCYLLVEGDSAVLVDTGYAAHAAAIRGQIETLIGRNGKLSLFPLRLNEFMSINNVETLAAELDVEQCYTANPDAAWWFDFGATSDQGRPVLDRLKITAIRSREELSVGDTGGRLIDVFEAPIRLIATRWIYDRATKTLLSSDMFTHVWRDSARGPWVVGPDEAPSTFEHVRSYLLNTRYWWTEGVRTGVLREGVAKVFETYDVETLAPGYGAIIRGRERVAHEFKVLDEVLASLDESRTRSRYVDRNEER